MWHRHSSPCPGIDAQTRMSVPPSFALEARDVMSSKQRAAGAAKAAFEVLWFLGLGGSGGSFGLCRSGRCGGRFRFGFRRWRNGLFDGEADSLLIGVEVEDLDLDVFAGLDDVGGAADAVGRKLGDVDEAFNARFELHEGAEIGDARNDAGHDLAGWVLFSGIAPGAGEELFEAE